MAGLTTLRFKARRAPYRRAGVGFSSSTDWLQVSSDEIEEGTRVRLLADVSGLEAEMQDDNGEWSPVSLAERAEAGQQLDAQALLMGERLRADYVAGRQGKKEVFVRSERYTVRGLDDAVNMAFAVHAWAKANPESADAFKDRLQALAELDDVEDEAGGEAGAPDGDAPASRRRKAKG